MELEEEKRKAGENGNETQVKETLNDDGKENEKVEAKYDEPVAQELASFFSARSLVAQKIDKIGAVIDPVKITEQRELLNEEMQKLSKNKRILSKYQIGKTDAPKKKQLLEELLEETDASLSSAEKSVEQVKSIERNQTCLESIKLLHHAQLNSLALDFDKLCVKQRGNLSKLAKDAEKLGDS